MRWEFITGIENGARTARPEHRYHVGSELREEGASVAAHRFFGRPHVALEAPFVDDFGVEAPVGANSEARQFAAAQKFVNR